MSISTLYVCNICNRRYLNSEDIGIFYHVARHAMSRVSNETEGNEKTTHVCQQCLNGILILVDKERGNSNVNDS